MNKIILFFCVGLLTSCSLFKKSVKFEDKLDSLYQIGLTTIKENVDTSKAKLKEKIKITMPARLFLDFPFFGMPDIVNSRANLHQNASILLQQTSSLNQNSPNGISVGLAPTDKDGRVTFEYERDLSIEQGKSKKDNTISKTKTHIKKESKSNEKDAINPWLAGGVAIALIVAAYFFFKK